MYKNKNRWTGGGRVDAYRMRDDRLDRGVGEGYIWLWCDECGEETEWDCDVCLGCDQRKK